MAPWWQESWWTSSDRYKGIGFLSVARYCGSLHVETRSLKAYRGTRLIQRRNRTTVPFEEIAGSLLPSQLIDGSVSLRRLVAVSGTKAVKLTAGSDYGIASAGVRLLSARARAAKLLEFTYEVDCSGITLEAELDFDYLLSLEKQADLRLLDDFCTATFRATDPKQPPFTRVQLRRLREFVVRDLSAPRAKGKARNIVFKSGKEQFFWRLSRTSPIRDEVPSELELGGRPQSESASSRSRLARADRLVAL